MKEMYENNLRNYIDWRLNTCVRQMGQGYALHNGDPVAIGAIGYCINGQIISLPFHHMNPTGIDSIRMLSDSQSMKRVSGMPITVSVGLPINVPFPTEPHPFIERIKRFNKDMNQPFYCGGYGMTILAAVLFYDEQEDCNISLKPTPQKIYLFD